MSKPVRVRFAPSPTGYLHVGGARTALFDYIFAKNQGGQFILRVEDTDQARSTEEALRKQLEDLVWLGLDWDEGVDPESLEDRGPHGPYRQSQRLPIYKKYADQLLSEGRAYYCFLTDEEIEAQREEAKRQGRPPQVVSPYSEWSLGQAQEKLAQGDRAVVRFRTKDLKRDYKFTDLVRGEVSFPSDMVGDFVLLRSDGMPVYNFCCTVDDALMEITHVFRAEEHLSNTLRQMMIYEALGFDLPEFAHLSLVLGEDRQKLSKRHGATSCEEYRRKGYLPEALKNFIALLGWSHPEGREVMTQEEMIEKFDLRRVNSAGAVFDEKKLKWMNSEHLRALPDEKLWAGIEPFLQAEGIELGGDPSWQSRALATFRSAMETFADAPELMKPLDDKLFTISDESQMVYEWDSTPKVLTTWKELVEKAEADYLSEEQFGELQDQVKVAADVKGKQLFMPIRVAVIGKPQGAELKTLVPLISRASLVQRAKKAIEFKA